VKVWDVVLDLAAWSDRADGHPFDDRLAALNAHRTEMRQRHRVAVGGLDRHGSATHRHGAGKRDRPWRGCKHRRSGWSADVDSPVLAGGIRIVAEDERLKNRSLDGPGPRSRGRGDHKRRRRDHDDQSSPHLFLLVVLIANSDSTIHGVAAVVNPDYSEVS
jgi:hypothetical protein